MDLSFSGAGFMGCYYFGVVDCFNKYIPRERVNRVTGSSAGSLIAAYYLLDLPLSKCLGTILEMLDNYRSRPLGVFDRSYQMVDVLPKALDEMFPEDAHKRVSNRLYVCMTRLKDMKKVLVNEFETRKDLIDALNCSCFIPVWSGNHVSTYKGEKYIDGGISDNLPVFDEHTIRICCFSGATDISPFDRVKMDLLSGTILNMPFYVTLGNLKRMRRALFPPPASYVLQLLQRGFHDTKNFILSEDLIQCNSCYDTTDLKDQPIYSKLSPTITPSVTPHISPAVSHSDLRDAGKPDASNRLGGAHSTSLSPGARCSGQKSSSFRRLLQTKLESCSSFSEESRGSSPDANNNNNSNSRVLDSPVPTIVLGDLENPEWADTGAGRGASSGMSPSEKYLAKRRNTTQLTGDQLLVDRFKLAPNPLPSCPPSPNLNRHCVECIRLRQEARADLLEDEMMRELDKYLPTTKSSSKMKLKSPLRWVRQLARRSSYSFESQVLPAN